MPSIWTSVFRLPHQIINQLFHQASDLLIRICIKLKSLNTHILPKRKLLLYIDGAKANALVFFSYLQLIILSLGIGSGEY